VEHWLVKQSKAVRWSLSVLAFGGVIALMGGASATGPKGLLVGYLVFLVLGFVVSRVTRATRRSSAVSPT